jgi:hypothetical protein
VTYEVGVHPSTCARKRQRRQGHILSHDEIVPAERPAGRGTGTDADLEVKRPGLVKYRKLAGSCYRLHRVIGPHGNDRYNLNTDTDQRVIQGRWQCRCWPKLSTYIQLPNVSIPYYLPELVPVRATPSHTQTQLAGREGSGDTAQLLPVQA